MNERHTGLAASRHAREHGARATTQFNEMQFDNQPTEFDNGDDTAIRFRSPLSHLLSSEVESPKLKLPHAKLVVERGAAAGKEFVLLEDESHIGRWDADGGVFPDVDLDSIDGEAKVSRRHARIVRDHEGYAIEDLGSTNGTFVNRGRRLLAGSLHPLTDEDEIIVGKTFLRLKIVK